MLIDKNVFHTIEATIGSRRPESYGIIGQVDNVIRAYSFCGHNGDSICDIDNELLSTIIYEWKTKGIQFAGIVHSHPNRAAYLSSADKKYVHCLIEANHPMRESYTLYFPIVLPSDEKHSFEMVSYKVCSNGEVVKEDSIIQV